uniref:phage major tail protein, TP901-1 family n=1 Tax=Enterococcus faecalis TaxID=1351 RepID=UPI0022DFFC32
DFSATSILSVGDPYVDQLEEALDNDDIIEIWEINKAEKGTGDNADKYKATYYQGYVTSFGKSPNKGFATLTADQEEVVQYVFKDTTIETADLGK